MKIHTHTPKGHGMLEMCLPLSRQAQLQRERDTDGAKRGCVLESRGGGVVAAHVHGHADTGQARVHGHADTGQARVHGHAGIGQAPVHGHADTQVRCMYTDTHTQVRCMYTDT